MSSRLPLTRRTSGVVALCAATLVLATPAAFAAVNTITGPTSIVVTSDGAGDSIVLTCPSGQVKVNGGADQIACNVVETISVNGNDGNDSVDLSDLVAGDFPVLRSVSIDGGGHTDTIQGSFFGDRITADGVDNVQSFGGEDVVTGGDSAFGGDGDDILVGTQGDVSGGAGDDRIVDPGIGPYDGGTGYDTLEAEFAVVFNLLATNWVISDTVLHLDIPEVMADRDNVSLNIDRYVVTMPSGAPHTWSSAAFSGDTDLTMAQQADVVVLGPGADLVQARGGNDRVTGGAGLDYLRGGTGDDVIHSRDGAVDRVDCGDGSDTVTADYADLVTGCESVKLPPPVTSAIKGPKTVKKGNKATFTFSSKTPGAKFQCKLDKSSWKSCKSPFGVATRTFKVGSKHVLKVRAVLGGLKDATPSKKAFTVTKP